MVLLVWVQTRLGDHRAHTETTTIVGAIRHQLEIEVRQVKLEVPRAMMIVDLHIEIEIEIWIVEKIKDGLQHGRDLQKVDHQYSMGMECRETVLSSRLIVRVVFLLDFRANPRLTLISRRMQTVDHRQGLVRTKLGLRGKETVKVHVPTAL